MRSMARVELVAFSPSARPGMKARKVDASLRALAHRDLGAEIPARLFAQSITAEADAPADLAYLQDAWARVTALDCPLVLDLYARRWWPGTPRPFFVENELTLDFQSAPTPGLGHLAQTHGLLKFGLPDLAVAGLEPADGPRAAQLLVDAVGLLLAGGTLPIGPRVFEVLRVEKNTLPLRADHLVLRDAGFGPPTIRRYLRRG